jgi:hypothetical protein
MIPDNISALLIKLYGSVEREKRFTLQTHPDDFKATKRYHCLKAIFEALQEYRGYTNLISSNSVRCDCYLPSIGYILEWDERQHFSIPRKIALSLYPEDLKLGFDKKRWIGLCEKIRAEDNDKNVLHRYEQREWLDTLRDFLPELTNGPRITVRMYDKDPYWRSLNCDNPESIEKLGAVFRHLL